MQAMFIYYRKFIKTLKTYYEHHVHQLMKETSLHGLKFVADSSLSLWERGFFLCYFVTAFIISINLVKELYNSYENTPIIVGTNPEASSVLDIPFPAVILCNLNNLQKSKVANYSRDSAEGFLMKLICKRGTLNREEYANAAKYENTTNWTISSFSRAHTQPCSEMLMYCHFNSKQYNCSDIFIMRTTDDGLCCSFNFLHPIYDYRSPTSRDTSEMKIKPVDWSPETGWVAHNFSEFSPMPPRATGILMGLSLTLNADIDEYYCSKSNGAGFKVAVRSPLDSRRIMNSALSVPLTTETQLRISPSGSVVAHNLHSISAEKRKCIFDKEKELIFHSHYTQELCTLECKTIYFFKTCGCILYYMPPIYSNTTECSFKDLLCAWDAGEAWNRGFPEQKECVDKCPPPCVIYNWAGDAFTLPFSTYNFSVNHFINTLPQKFIFKNVAVLLVYYRGEHFYSELKNVYIGVTEFLSNSGGILGLFMGFSVMSIAEIVYFIIIRPFLHMLHVKFFHKPQHTKRILVTPVVKMESENWLHSEIYKPRKNFHKKITPKIKAKP